jgi:tyrosine-protein phosphatase YwqE
VLFSNLFRKESKKQEDLAWLGADMHSHLLPGIDDGSPDIETSIGLITGFQRLGFKKIITTPHILWEMYPNTPEIINARLQEVRDELKNRGVDIELHAAAEYFIDEHFAASLTSRDPLLTIKGNQVLVEVSTITAPFDMKEVLFEMQMQNYQPVIAHPERYIYLKQNKEFFEELRDSGCLFQLNLLALVGHYGSAVQELATWLMKNEFYEYAGTDLHHFNHLNLLSKLFHSPLYQKLKESGQVKNHLL